MLFWIAVAVLAAAVTYVITRPLMRPPLAIGDAAQADIAVYKDQLSEIDADQARGTIGASEAELARAEIARRLIRKGGDAQEDVPAGGSFSKWVASAYLIVTLALPASALMLYLMLGAAGLPGQPLSERLAHSVDRSRTNDLVAKVEERLRTHPEDGEGWNVIAPVYYSMGRYGDAASAYARAARLLGETPHRLQGFANARIRAEDGIVPEDARKALERILELDPSLREPQIWLALAKEQDGKLNEAGDAYRKLIAEAPADAPWRKMLEERLAGLSLPDDQRAKIPFAVEKRPQQSAETDMAAIQAMTPEQRQAFIDQMVERLATRLKSDTKNTSGWLQLIRAYQMLGRKDEAEKAVVAARAGLQGDADGLAQIDQIAKRLGLGG